MFPYSISRSDFLQKHDSYQIKHCKKFDPPLFFFFSFQETHLFFLCLESPLVFATGHGGGGKLGGWATLLLLTLEWLL